MKHYTSRLARESRMHSGSDGPDWEIFRATIPEPGSLLLFLGAGVAILRRVRP